MVGEENWDAVAPAVKMEREDQWSNFDDSVNAVSFGFVATAILISMFLVMAIFERFLRLRPTSFSPDSSDDIEAQRVFLHGKLHFPSPKVTRYGGGVSVLMPGEETPTFIAHPAPAPCPPDRILLPLH